MTMYDPAKDYATAVLVTGATGMIGSAVCRDLVTHGYRVLGLVRTPEAKEALSYGVVPVVGDIRDPVPWESAIDRADAVIHLAVPAGKAHGAMKTHEDARRDADEMAAILDRLCHFVRRNKKRFIYTFGAVLYDPDAKGWVRETSGISRGRGFGIRHAACYPVLARQRKRGLKAVGLGPAFVYGLGGRFERDLLEPMSRGQSSYVGEGTQIVHYVEAGDAAVAYRLALDHALDGEDYLLADDKPTTMGAVARLVARAMGAPEPVSVPEEDLIPAKGAWAVEAVTFCPKVDSTKAREQLGWAPRYRTIEEGIPAVVRAWRRSRAATAA